MHFFFLIFFSFENMNNIKVLHFFMHHYIMTLIVTLLNRLLFLFKDTTCVVVGGCIAP